MAAWRQAATALDARANGVFLGETWSNIHAFNTSGNNRQKQFKRNGLKRSKEEISDNVRAVL